MKQRPVALFLLFMFLYLCLLLHYRGLLLTRVISQPFRRDSTVFPGHFVLYCQWETGGFGQKRRPHCSKQLPRLWRKMKPCVFGFFTSQSSDSLSASVLVSLFHWLFTIFGSALVFFIFWHTRYFIFHKFRWRPLLAINGMGHIYDI